MYIILVININMLKNAYAWVLKKFLIFIGKMDLLDILQMLHAAWQISNLKNIITSIRNINQAFFIECQICFLVEVAWRAQLLVSLFSWESSASPSTIVSRKVSGIGGTEISSAPLPRTTNKCLQVTDFSCVIFFFGACICK